MKARIAFGAITVAASTLVGIAISEGWDSTAKPPVKGDVPTYGFGTTRHADGSPVKAGETITPQKALGELLREVQAMDGELGRCIGDVPMYPHEKSAYVSLAYNIGTGAFCGSTLVRKLKAGDYSGACAEIKRWDKFKGHPLRGLTVRREREYRECMGDA